MLLSTVKNPIFRLLKFLKENTPYNIFSSKEWENSLEVTDEQVRKSNVIAFFSIKNGSKNVELDAQKMFLCDKSIDTENFIQDTKRILNDKTSKHQIFCKKTIEVIVSRASGIQNDWLHNMTPVKGVLHLTNHPQTSFIYDIQNEGEDKKFTIYNWLGHIDLLGIKTSGILKKDGTIQIHEEQTAVILQTKAEESKNFNTESHLNMVSLLFHLLFFLEHAEVETKIVNNKKRKAVVDGEKVVNMTDFSLEVINSTYYTTIIRDEQFGVKGHFRWQPYGEGRSKLKYMYIKDFVKNGYTRKAKILAGEEQQPQEQSQEQQNNS